MQGLRPGALDLTGRQRSLWGQVLRALEAEGQLQASLPQGLGSLPVGKPPEAWIDLAEARGQVLPWMLRQLELRPHDPTLHGLGHDLGLCVDSRERLQCSLGWRHWTGLDSAVQGLALWPAAASLAAQPGSSRTVTLEAWARRLLCLWQGGPAGAGLPWIPRRLVLDLGGGQLLPLDEAAARPLPPGLPAVSWQLGTLPRHALDEPRRAEARFQPEPPLAPQGLVCADGQTLPSPAEGPGPAAWGRLRQAGPSAPLLGRDRLGDAQAGPVLLLGADPGQPPRLCLALLQRNGSAWCHDADPVAMAGGGLCLDPQCRLLGYFRPMNTAGGRVLALLWS